MRMLEEMQLVEAWVVKFQIEARALWGNLYNIFELRIFRSETFALIHGPQ